MHDGFCLCLPAWLLRSGWHYFNGRDGNYYLAVEAVGRDKVGGHAHARAFTSILLPSSQSHAHTTPTCDCEDAMLIA